MMKSIIREPLFHFVVLGGLLFSAWSWVGSSTLAESNSDKIVIDQSRVNHLQTLWKAQWKRDPAPEDLVAIIDRYLRQEVFYREALNMGLDKDDYIIRTRLAQKMEAVASDLSSLMNPPTEAELREFHQQRADLFTLPAAMAFDQILFLPSEMESRESEQLLEALQTGGKFPADRLNKLSVPSGWELTSVQVINNAFGRNFSETLSQVPVGEWVGPVRSGLGHHLVRVRENEPAHLTPFEEIEEYVAQQYEYYSVLGAQKEMFQELLEKYQVEINAKNVPEQVLQEYTQP